MIFEENKGFAPRQDEETDFHDSDIDERSAEARTNAKSAVRRAVVPRSGAAAFFHVVPTTPGPTPNKLMRYKNKPTTPMLEKKRTPARPPAEYPERGTWQELTDRLTRAKLLREFKSGPLRKVPAGPPSQDCTSRAQNEKQFPQLARQLHVEDGPADRAVEASSRSSRGTLARANGSAKNVRLKLKDCL